MKRWIIFLACISMSAGGAAADEIVKKRVGAGFEDAKDALVAAIENRGLVVSYVAHVGEMLDRTGKDIGATRKVYADAQTLEFCSATVSREMMEKDPANIVHCPYSVSVYALPGEAKVSWIAYRRPPPKPAFKALDKLLGDIAAEASRQ